MTPSLFDLPLRLADAVLLAELLFEHAEGKPMGRDLRARLAGRAGGIEFGAMRPYLESLERDPIHPSAYLVCVDGVCVDGVADQPLLLRLALATAPSSGLFPKAILIGRTNVRRHEIVVNVVPFGPGEYERLQTFGEHVNPAFLPKPLGTRPVIRVRSVAPERTFPAAFDGFEALLRATGQNLACFAQSAGQDAQALYYATLWSAIRSGWREGYAVEAYPESAGEATAAAVCTRFGVRTAELAVAVRHARRKPFDLELIASPETLEASLAALREMSFSAQSVSLEGQPPDLAALDLAPLEEIAMRYRTILNLRDVELEQGLSPAEIAALLAGR